MDGEEHDTGSVQLVLVSALIGGVMFIVAQGGFFDGMFQREILLNIDYRQQLVFGGSDTATTGADANQTASMQ